jgi:putative ABC transport system permease protein
MMIQGFICWAFRLHECAGLKNAQLFFSVLLALGWKRGRIICMVLWESALLGLFGGVAGVAIGAIGVQILGTMPAICGLLKPDVSIGLLAISVAIAVAVGVLSGLYPAWRSSRLRPSLALQG